MDLIPHVAPALLDTVFSKGKAQMTFDPLPVALPVGPQEPVEAPHWEGLAAGELRLQHCLDCDYWIWSPSWICPKCHNFDPPWEAVNPIGTVFSYTTTHHVFPASREFEGYTPYVTALVSLTEAGGRRLLGMVVGDQNIELGSKVKAWIQPGSDLTDDWPVLRWYKADGC